MFKKTLLAVSVTTLLSGCITTPDAPEGVCHSSNKKSDIVKNEVKAATSQGKKAIVLPVDVASGIDFPKTMGKAFQNRLESQIDASGAKLVDRSLSSKKKKQLKKEIAFAEKHGDYKPTGKSGANFADYAVLAEVTSANLSYSFKDKETKTDDEGNTKHYPAKCTYTGEVEGLVKVVALPSREIVKRIEIKGRETSSFEQKRPNSNCPISNGQYKRIVEVAAKNAVNRNDDLKNQFAPSGVIEELRQCEEYGAMVRVNMGSKLGIHPEQDVEILSPEVIELADGRKETELYRIGPGKTADEDNRQGIKPTYSWVGINDEDVKKIQLGDLVEARYDSGCNDLIEPLRTLCWEAYEGMNGKG